ncbi:Uncharacterised protein [Acinetobacter baumannii]|nr:Uncharacterised protein [Acinetobacter baumannii]SST60997.1 Uncharacterised protein [Acinetobacter baumannii]SSU06547.1 Uncharacterised protein [Acinetobacter baumannii]SSU12793.1 Uncharacterised protein [Acinetobacter baumannii]SSV18540.1 Uncharacterised protein [Acinetobacter baumannii]
MLAAIFPIVVCVTLAYPIFKIFSVKGVAFYSRCSAVRVVQQEGLSGLFILFLLLSTIIYLLSVYIRYQLIVMLSPYLPMAYVCIEQ